MAQKLARVSHKKSNPLVRLDRSLAKDQPMSAPAIYNPAAVWPVIFEAISNGASLTEAMRQPNMPSLAWAKRQLQHDPDLQRAYQAAIVERAQALADQIVHLSDSQPPPDLEGAALSAWVQQLKLRLWARTWVAAKLAPRQWGERLDVSVTETRISITAALKALARQVGQRNGFLTRLGVNQVPGHGGRSWRRRRQERDVGNDRFVADRLRHDGLGNGANQWQRALGSQNLS